MTNHSPIKKRKLGDYAVLNIVFNTTLALLVLGLFGLLLLHTNKLAQIIREHVQIQVCLDKHITKNQTLRIDQALRQQAFVLKKNGHPQVTFLSKEAAARKFIKETGENFLNILDNNPLRDVYLVHIAPGYQKGEQLIKIKQDLEAIEGIFEVDYIPDFIASMNKIIVRVSTILGICAGILLAAVTVLMRNTIKLAIYAQRFLIRSMDLVGATPAFIRRPFVFRGALIGLLAGILADSLLLLLLHYANKQVTSLATLQEPIQIFALLGAIVLLGVLVGFGSTYSAVNRYLRMSLDELY